MEEEGELFVLKIRALAHRDETMQRALSLIIWKPLQICQRAEPSGE